MKLKFIALSLCVAASVNLAKAQNNSVKETSSNKHEIRVTVSDGLTQGSAGIMGNWLSDAVLGSKRTDQSYSMVYGLGYRYTIGRFRVGGDLGFSQSKSKLTLAGDNTPSLKERELDFLVLPTADFTYFKRRLVELYGSASAGVNMSKHTETGMTAAGKQSAAKPELKTSFAYQVNPIAVRVGNDRVGGFLEAGFGHKGFVTAGISVKF